MKRIKSALAKIDRKSRPWAIWVWNEHIDESAVIDQMNSFVDAGFGGVAIRPGRDMAPAYMSEEFFGLFETALAYAQAGNIGIRIADDFAFPLNGFFQTLAIYDGEIRAKRLVLRHVKILENKDSFELATADPDSLLVLASKLKNGKIVQSSTKRVTAAPGKDTIVWKPTSTGEYQVMVFQKEYVTDPDGHYLPNVFSAKTAKVYLEEMVDEYRIAFSRYMPGTFEGLITEVPACLPSDNSIPWDDDLVSKYKTKYKKDITKLVPGLFFDVDEDDQKDRVQVYQFMSQLMHERFSATIETWVKKHRLSQWVLAPERPLLTNKNILTDTCVTTSSALSSFGCQNQEGTEQSYASVRMVADSNALEHKRETVSVVGRNREGHGGTLQSIKTEIDMHAQCGPSRVLIDGCYFNLDHRGHVRSPFNPGWYYPAWDQAKHLCDYSARLQQVLMGLHLNRTVAVLHPTVSMTADYLPGNNESVNRAKQSLDRVVAELQRLNIDFDIVTEDFLHASTVRANGEFGVTNRVRKGNYQALVVPYSRLTTRSSFVFLEKLATKKGTVVFVDEPPQGSIEDGTGTALTKRIEKLLRAKSGLVKVSSSKELGLALKHLPTSVKVTAGGKRNSDLSVTHGSETGCEVYLVHNNSDQRDHFVTLEVPTAKYFYIADCETGDLHEVKDVEKDGKSASKISITVAPKQTHVLIGAFSKAAVSAPTKTKGSKPETFTTKARSYRIVLKDQWSFVPDSLNALPLANWTTRIGLSRETGGYSHFSESHFEAKEIPQSCILVMPGESVVSMSDAALGSGFEVAINGNVVEPFDARYIDEEDLDTVALWKGYCGENATKFNVKDVLVRGFNRISLRSVGAMSDPRTVMYPPLIAGTFSITKGSRGWTIDRPASVVGYDSWTTHGFPYLSGQGIYKQEFELPADYKRIVLKFSKTSGSIDVTLNGKQLGMFNWHPMAIDVTSACEQRRNSLQVRVGNTMDNVLRMNGRPSGLTGEAYLDVY